MLRTFPHIRFGLMVGVRGGAPNPHPQDAKEDIRLGDVVVSGPRGSHGGVIQYDRGKETDDDFDIQSHLNKPPGILLKAVNMLQSDHGFKRDKTKEYMADVNAKAEMLPDFGDCHFPGRGQDRLFKADNRHVNVEGRQDCSACDLRQTVRRRDRQSDEPVVHLGLIASANRVMKSAQHREKLRKAWNVSCFETEAAGLMNDFPFIVIRGICDHSDDHKNKAWQPYAAVAAAAYAKDLLRIIQPSEVQKAPRAADVTNLEPEAPKDPKTAGDDVSRTEKNGNHSETTGKLSHHGGYCFLGEAKLDNVDKALASDRDAFREDLRRLM
ncbi:hypothetical protein VTN00DRAFT_6908 [Thermoascus crustaceus]|uniref:uncharacterized protein n=1 Tax=Thermoascus crustaceus TaxID=5088 RepID=UPI003742892D